MRLTSPAVQSTWAIAQVRMSEMTGSRDEVRFHGPPMSMMGSLFLQASGRVAQLLYGAETEAQQSLAL